MWETALIFVLLATLTYFLKKYRKVLNFIIFYTKFCIIYTVCTFIIFIWPFPILNGRSLENGKKWSSILKHLTVLVDVEWELQNGEVLAKNRAAVIVSNHQSCVDVIGMFNIWDTVDKLIAMVKRDIIFILPMAVGAYLSGAVLVDRRNPKNVYKQFQKISDDMIKQKAKVWVFPEGTRNYDYGTFLPFKKGAFTLAVAAQTPILPVIYSPYYFIDRKNYTFTKSRVIIRCLEEVPTTGLTMDDVPELIERVRGMMLAAYKELADEVIPTTLKRTDYLDKNNKLK